MRKTAFAMSTVLFGVIWWGSGCNDVSCANDLDCKGDRICVASVCLDPSEVPNTSSSSGGSSGSGERCHDFGNGKTICLQTSNPGPTSSEMLVGKVPAPPGPVPASGSLNLNGFTVPDQGWCGSCAAFATRSAMGIRAVTQQGKFEDFSPAHIWYIAGYSSADCTDGSSIYKIFSDNKHSAEHVVPDAVWHYDTSNIVSSLDTVPPANTLFSSGIAYISKFVTVSPNSVNELKYAILQGWAPVLAVPVVWSDWGDHDVTGTGDYNDHDGLHAIAVIGYDDAQERFTFMNSWGADWGNAGKGTMSYDFVTQQSRGGTVVQELKYKPSGGTCGDGICDNGETQSSCCVDCGCPAGSGCQNGSCVPGSSCGNGTATTSEACDGNDLKGQTCATFGFQNGQLSCNADCTLNTTGCFNGGTCGDGACSGGETQSSCCADCGCPAGSGCQNGSCVPGSQCGNSVKEGSEVCDGFDLGGATCQSQGYGGGSLTCNGSCSGYSTGSCCSNDCSPGATTCSNGVVQSCGNYDADACYELGTIQTCTNGQTCIGSGCGCPSGNTGKVSVTDYVYPNFGPPGCSGDGTLKLKAAAAMTNPSTLRVYIRKADDGVFTTSGTLTLYVGTGPTCPNPPNVVKATKSIVVGATEQTIDLTVDPYGASWTYNETKQFWVGKDEGGYQSWRASNIVSAKRTCIP